MLWWLPHGVCTHHAELVHSLYVHSWHDGSNVLTKGLCSAFCLNTKFLFPPLEVITSFVLVIGETSLYDVHFDVVPQ